MCRHTYRKYKNLKFNSIFLFMTKSHIIISACLSVCVSVCLSIYLSIYLSVCLSNILTAV